MKKIPLGNCLYEFHCDPKLTESALDYLSKSKIYWLNSSGYDSYNEAGYLDENYEVPYYHEELFDWIQTCIDQVVAEELPSAKLVICDSWVTRSKFGRSHPQPHHHSNSMLSGIFYFTSHPKAKTIFYKHKPLSMIIEKMLLHTSDINVRDYFFKEKDRYESNSVAGKLVIFPSNVDHSITTNTDVKPIRHTLAFNTYLTGIVPTDMSSGRLEINVKSSKEKYLEWLAKKEQNA